MKKKTILNILIIICFIVMIGSGIYLALYYYNSHKSESNMNNLRNMIIEEDVEKKETEKNTLPEMVTVDGISVQKKFSDLYRKNNDFIGWIKIDDTYVDYPVMYSPNDTEKGEYYIHRDFQKEYSAAGTPFIDRNCKLELPTDNVIIYAHNMNSGKMFHDIIKFQDREFYEQHKTFQFDSIYEDGTYEVIAAFYGKILEKKSKKFKYYEFVNAGSEEEFNEYIKEIKNMSIIDTNSTAEYGDKLITLSTCAYHTKNGRFAVVAKKLDN